MHARVHDMPGTDRLPAPPYANGYRRTARVVAGLLCGRGARNKLCTLNGNMHHARTIHPSRTYDLRHTFHTRQSYSEISIFSIAFWSTAICPESTEKEKNVRFEYFVLFREL